MHDFFQMLQMVQSLNLDDSVLESLKSITNVSDLVQALGGGGGGKGPVGGDWNPGTGSF